jgi:hypothetical protein
MPDELLPVRKEMRMDGWPDFVKDEEAEWQSGERGTLTGWETVIFEVEDQEVDSSTAAFAP